MRSDDPMKIIDQNLDDLKKLSEVIAGERQKWSQAREALELFGADSVAAEPIGRSPVSEVRFASDTAAANDSVTVTNAPAKFTIPPHRRRVLVELLSAPPMRLWRTGDLADAVHRYEPESGDLRNLVSRALSVLEAEGLVERVKKGTVRWIGGQQQLNGGTASRV